MRLCAQRCGSILNREVSTDAAALEASLTADDFTEIGEKRLEPRPANGEYGHHFTARGMIVEGAVIITQEDVERTYRPGEVFEVPEGCLHCEAVEP
jgi:hypothetical protein